MKEFSLVKGISEVDQVIYLCKQNVFPEHLITMTIFSSFNNKVKMEG